ncbi:MAG: SdrD B-like domain-containing protein [Steroidobacteraceae bacterium]
MYNCGPNKLHRALAALLTLLVMCLSLSTAQAQATGEVTSDDVVNQATAAFNYAGSNLVNELQSNTVHATVVQRARSIQPPTIAFFRDAQYQHQTTVADFGEQVFLQTHATGCDFSANSHETATITIHAELSGDTETLSAHETAVGSGIFNVVRELWVLNADEQPVVAGDGLFQVHKDDAISASIDACGSGTAETWLLIDPMGTVFDSRTNAPVPGAVVQLIDITGAGNGGHAGAAAVVFQADGVTAAPSTVTTDAEGHFQFPLVAPSQYQLIVAPPNDYSFPSKRAAGELPNGRTIHLFGSYGGEFVVDATTGTVTLDVPADATPSGLFVQKTAARDNVEIAESVEYSIEVKNVSGMKLDVLNLRDDLPAGFGYIAGSARLDGKRINDPQGGKGPTLNFDVDALNNNESHTLTYRALVGAGALQGDGINRAQATSSWPAIKISNVASAAVKVSAGVFDDKAYVLGRIYNDCNANGVQDAGEAGIAGVRLYMEDGSFVISDDNGSYSFYGVSPRTHVLKVDGSTLPAGATLAAISHRNAGDGNSVFVDVKRGELHRADFATQSCVAASVTQQKPVSAIDNELTLGLKSELKFEAAKSGDVRALPASGVIGEAHRQTAIAAVSDKPWFHLEETSLNDAIRNVERGLGFVSLRNDQVVASNLINIRVTSWPRVRTALLVNGVEVPAQRIGARAVLEDRQIELREYIGVELRNGDNELTLSEYSDVGIIRTSRQIHITAPGPLAQVTMSNVTDTVDADGEVHARVRVQLKDAQGFPVTLRTPVTLESTLGEWQLVDMDSREPGAQTYVEGGQMEFALRSPKTPGLAQLRVTSGELAAQTQLSFVPALRPMVATGIVEGAINLRNLKFNSMQPAQGSDGFEQELTQFANGDDLTAGARAALFLKGKVKGDYLLTLAYDSDKDSRERLFRDIEPDRFYPVYGDSSVKGFDAQSTGKLYVRIDKNRSYFLVGDLTTQAIDSARSLGAYNRSLNGVREHYEQGRLTVDAFASQDSTRQIVEEIAANGTSGPYDLRTTQGLQNSERVEIITRDRNQPSVILSSVPLQRFADYEIETFTGHLVLNAPVPSVDANLNPISLRITYEVEQGGDKFWIGGVDTRVAVTKQWSVGAAVINDRNPQDMLQLSSVNSTLKFSEQTSLIAEVAQTERDSSGTGMGERMEFRHNGKQVQLRAFAGRTDAEFNNPSASMTANRSEGGAKASLSLTERTRLLGEALHTGDVSTGAERDGGMLSLEHSFTNKLKFETGVRHVQDSPADIATATTQTNHVDTSTTSVRTKLTTPVPFLSAATMYGEYEQDVSESEQRVAALGGDYQVAKRTRVYARHEFISSLNGPYTLDLNQKQNVTVFGVDTSYLQNDHVFSEYRVNNALDGRQAQAAIGLRNRWQLAEGLTFNTNLERVTALSGSADSENTALAGGLEYTRNPLWKGTARLEWRDGLNSRGMFSTLGVARKLTSEWSVLGKNVFAIERSKTNAPQRMQERLQIGLAFRDLDTNRIDALMRYEFKIETNTAEAALRRNAHIVSGHINYQPTQAWTLSGQYAAKLVTETTSYLRMHSNAQLIGGRVTRDLGKRWDVGVATRVLFSDGFSANQSATGIEAGFLVRENLWISTGFNVTGFHDRDLSADEYTDRGAYLRLRYKFDETLLSH